MKVCKICNLEKDELEFYKDKRMKSGYVNRCKLCHAQYCKNYFKEKDYVQNLDLKEKCCNRCKTVKLIDNFNKHRRMPDGFNSECKECITKRYSAFEYRFRMWKRGAKTRKIKFELQIEDLKNLPNVCYYTGRELTLDSNKDNTLSLDRIDSNIGYIKSNVVFCCNIINHMKWELSINQFLNWCDAVVQNRKVNLS